MTPLAGEARPLSDSPLVLVLDSGHPARRWWPALGAGVRHALEERGREGGEGGGALDAGVCVAGDYRCHLLQAAPFRATRAEVLGDLARFHFCGLDRSYESAFYYYARHCPMPDGARGDFVVSGTGPFRDAVSAAHVRQWFGDDIREHPVTYDLIRELSGRFRVAMVYLVRNVYDTGWAVWEDALGRDNVVLVRRPSQFRDALSCVHRHKCFGNPGDAPD